MAAFRIELTDEAKEDLYYFTAHERKALIAEIRAQLSYQPLVTTRNRKPLRLNPIASWEFVSASTESFMRWTKPRRVCRFRPSVRRSIISSSSEVTR